MLPRLSVVSLSGGARRLRFRFTVGPPGLSEEVEERAKFELIGCKIC